MDALIIGLRCRVCESKDLLINIFTNKSHNIDEKLGLCASVQVSEDDGLPQHICTKCFADLQLAYEFRIRCQESDARLRFSLKGTVMLKEMEISSTDIEIIEELEHEIHSASEYEKKYLRNTMEEMKDVNQMESNVQEEISDSIIFEYSNEQESGKKSLKTYTCTTCGEVFSLRWEYYAHIRAHGAQRFQCKTCLKWFTRRSALIQHELRHEGKLERVPCDRCSLDFSCRAALLRHIAGVHENRRSYVCAICGHSFAQKTGLQAHQSVHNGSQFKCTKCDASFKRLQFFLRHEQMHLPLEQRDPKLMFTTKSTYKNNHSRLYMCSYCGKTTYIYNDHKQHERAHRNERPYPCKVCGKAFFNCSLLKKHLRIHTGEKPHKCDICGKCFREKSHLTTHNLTHTQERKHVCIICSKAFALKCTLKSHMKRHAVCDDNEITK